MTTRLQNIGWTLAALLPLFFSFCVSNSDNGIKIFEGLYLRHLKAEEGALQKKALALVERKCPQLGKGATEQQIESYLACEKKFTKDFQTLTDQLAAIHQKRLRLDVKWGIADSEQDAKELGWHYPRPEWDGQKWTCPVGTSPYEIDTEKQAGALQYVHCLSEKEAKDFN